MSDIGPQPDASPAATPKEPERGERAGVPEPSRIESWLRTLTGFENARVVGVEPDVSPADIIYRDGGQALPSDLLGCGF